MAERDLILGDHDHMGDTEAKFTAPMTIRDLVRFCSYSRLSQEEIDTLGAAINVLAGYAITPEEVEEIRARRRRKR